MFDVASMPTSIEIGYTGEQNFRTIEIDMTKWMILMPDGVPSIVHTRPGESSSDAYIAATTFDSDSWVLSWTITESDLGSLEGSGVAQVWLEEEENNTLSKRGKSAQFATLVRGSVGSASSDVPAAQEGWLEQMTALKTATVNASETATGAKNTAVAAKTAAEAARDAAQAAAGDFQGMTASAETLTPGSSATVAVTHSEGGLYNFAFGVPQGIQGPQGNPAPAELVEPAVDAYLAQVITNPDSPPLDRTLSSSSAAAPADMVGDLKSAITNTNQAVENTNSNDILNFTNGYYINTGVSVGDEVSLTPVQGTDTNNYVIVDCSEGDIFTINGTGGNAGRLYCFVDSSTPPKALVVSNRNVTAKSRELTAPADGKLIVNMVGVPGVCFKGVYLHKRIDEEVDKIEDVLIKTNKAVGSTNSGDVFSFTNGYYINTGVSVGDEVSLTPVQGSDTNNYVIVSCAEGDVFTINGTGGNAGRLYCFVDSSTPPKALVVSNQNVTATDRELTAPANGKLIINMVGIPGVCFKGIYAHKSIAETNANVSKLDNRFRKISQLAMISDEVRFGNVFEGTQYDGIPTGENYSVTPVYYSGVHITGTIPTADKKYISKALINIVSGHTYTMYVLHDANLDIGINLFGVQYNGGDALDNYLNGRPFTFTAENSQTGTYCRIFQNTGSDMQIDDDIFIYLVEGEYTYQDFNILGYSTPEMFGAKGDGVADDTAAIQAAIDCGSGKVKLNGTYKITEKLIIEGSIDFEQIGVINYTGNDSAIRIRKVNNACTLKFATINAPNGNCLEFYAFTYASNDRNRVQYVNVYFDSFSAGDKCVYMNLNVTSGRDESTVGWLNEIRFFNGRFAGGVYGIYANARGYNKINHIALYNVGIEGVTTGIHMENGCKEWMFVNLRYSESFTTLIETVGSVTDFTFIGTKVFPRNAYTFSDGTSGLIYAPYYIDNAVVDGYAVVSQGILSNAGVISKHHKSYDSSNPSSLLDNGFVSKRSGVYIVMLSSRVVGDNMSIYMVVIYSQTARTIIPLREGTGDQAPLVDANGIITKRNSTSSTSISCATLNISDV